MPFAGHTIRIKIRITFLLQNLKIAVLRQQMVNAAVFHSTPMERFTRVALLIVITGLGVQRWMANGETA